MSTQAERMVCALARATRAGMRAADIEAKAASGETIGKGTLYRKLVEEWGLELAEVRNQLEQLEAVDGGVAGLPEGNLFEGRVWRRGDRPQAGR